jgi:hypothetical protein
MQPPWSVRQVKPVWGTPVSIPIPPTVKEITVSRSDVGTVPVTVVLE